MIDVYYIGLVLETSAMHNILQRELDGTNGLYYKGIKIKGHLNLYERGRLRFDPEDVIFITPLLGDKQTNKLRYRLEKRGASRGNIFSIRDIVDQEVIDRIGVARVKGVKHTGAIRRGLAGLVRSYLTE